MKGFRDYVIGSNKDCLIGYSFEATLVASLEATRNLVASLGEQKVSGSNIKWDDWDRGRDDDNEGIHHDPAIKPDLSNMEHNRALAHYCGTESNDPVHGHLSGPNINNHLRWLAGHRVAEGGEASEGIVGGHASSRVRDGIRKFDESFNVKTMNRKAINVFAGVPHHIGEKVESSGSGSEHMVPGAQSTSSTKYVARSYGDYFAKQGGKDVTHIMQIHMPIGTGRSSLHVSPFANEHEFVIPFGSHMRYSHTTVHKKDPNDYYGTSITKVHHMVLMNKRTKMEDYPNYPK